LASDEFDCGRPLSGAFTLNHVTQSAERSKEMATMSVTSKITRRKAQGRFWSRFFGFRKPTSPRLVVWEQTPVFNQALQTIRMAANPGEDYETVAVRIETQAAAYLEFLNNPQPIGRISLRVKQFGPAPTDAAQVHEQYRINEPSEGYTDPAEGGASVWYTFNRSNNKVLEFIVHDKEDNELFPIARTYTDWVGTKSFDLGLGRKFYLSLMERAPGYVNVRAGFGELSEMERYIYDAFEQSGTPRPERVPSAEPASTFQSGCVPTKPRSGNAAIVGIFIVCALVVAASVVPKFFGISSAHAQSNQADYSTAGVKPPAQDAGDISHTPISRTQQARVTK
jgi:hypothetical protein